MKFTFVVEVEVERERGKFATRDEISGQIQSTLEEADPGQYETENQGDYATASWDVNEQDKPQTKSRRRA